MKSFTVLSLGLLACVAPTNPASAPEPGSPAAAPLGVRAGALDAAQRTIPYSGYVDFDGQPVNAGSVAFNFALFPCASPGPGTCAPLWVARGTWHPVADWTAGWPTGALDVVQLPLFAGRFTVELGGAGQTALPPEVFEAGHDVLYLGVRIAGRPLAGLQKILPPPRSYVAARAFTADGATDFLVSRDLTVEGALLPASLVLPSDTRATLPDATLREGEMRYVEDEGRIVVSDGADWQPKLGTRQHPALDCAELRDAGERTTGTYWITAIPDGAAVATECRNDVQGGGWNLLIRGSLNTSKSPLSWFSHPWWETFGALGGPDEAVFAPAYSGVIPWSQLLVVKTGTADSLVLNSSVTASLFSGKHGNLTASDCTSGAAVSNGAVFTKDQPLGSGNGLVNRLGRWLTGACDGAECTGTHGFGSAGADHGSSWYPQATSMFQSYSYGGGSPESLSIYAR